MNDMEEIKSIFFLLLQNVLILQILAGGDHSHASGKCVHIDYRGKNTTQESMVCPSSPICSKSFNISYVHMPPYSAYPIEAILQKCCGNCTKVSKRNHFANITEVTPSSMNSSDFVLLFLGNTLAKTLYGYHFIPVVNAPSVFYVTTKDGPILMRLMEGCLNLYPLIVICLLMAAISGFFAWIMETWWNKEEFPRPFLIGWFEGFWWSFVSMTTVGYGDKTPKSFPARIFSVLWILIGVAMFGIFTALLTAEMMKANFPPNPHITGANVGVLRYREYDASVVAEYGGTITETNGWDFKSDIFFLIGMLRKKEIDGFVLDKYTLRYTITMMEKMKHEAQNETSPEQKIDIDFFLKNTLRTMKQYNGERLSYGILVKDDKDHEYFRDTIIDNRIPLETSIALDWNKKKNNATKHKMLFSPTGPYFMASVKVMSVIFGAICLFGFCYEICRRKIVEYEKHYETVSRVSWLSRV